MANVKFFTQGGFFYVADKGGAVTRYNQVSAIADALNNICRSQNVPHGPNDSNRELVDKILEHCGGYDSDPNQARVSVKLGKMIDAPIRTYHILRTETGAFHVLHRTDLMENNPDTYYLERNIIRVAREAGIKKYIDVYNKMKEIRYGPERDSFQAQYNVYDVFCEIYDFINSRK